MRNRELHDALRRFALEAAKLLRGEQGAGAELEFDLDEGSGRGGPTLYHYRPLTGRFIADRWTQLRMLESCEPAAAALGSGAEAYLRVNGLRGGESEPALQAMLERLYDDVTDFTFPEERFERVYAEVERTLFEKSRPATILVPVHGLELRADRVELGGGVALARGETTDAPDEAVWGDPAVGGGGGAKDSASVPNPSGGPSALLVFTRDVAPDAALPLEEARARFRRALSGLRLWKAGGVALAAVAWRRTGDGRWQPFELEPTGTARGEPWILVEGEDAELCEFLDALGGLPPAGRLAWALARFEMGCGRRLEAEALSDYLLALRALLDAGAEGGRSSLALRVAVLCAEEAERKRVQRRVELAQALERFVMADGADDDYLDAVGSDSPRTLVDELERHLRALLRDLMCGYLEPDLPAIADDLLLDQPGRGAFHSRFVTEDESGEFDSFEIRARALRDEPSTAAGRPRADSEQPTSEIEALSDSPAGEAELDDPAYWSAPV